MIIILYGIAIHIASLWSHQARLWIKGRNTWREDLKRVHPENKKLIWFHCASLGEFEQGKTLMDLIKKNHPEWFIALTFYSPSGYEIRKNYKHVDWVGYMPLDTLDNARDFVQMMNPKLCVFIKYEFWHHHIKEIHKQKIALLFIYSIFDEGHYLLRTYAATLLDNLKISEQIFVQDKASRDRLREKSFSNVQQVGDGRIDRVLQLGSTSTIPNGLSSFCQGHRVFIAGSTWQEDDEILIPVINEKLADWKIIIAPHKISEKQILNLENKLKKKCVRYSNSGKSIASFDILILDSIGLLSGLYSCCHIAYIGGGFGGGIHNILEPMAAGIPVLFGPNHKKFREARQIIKLKGGLCVQNRESLKNSINYLLDKDHYSIAQNVNREYLKQNKGATRKIYDYIIKNSLLEN